MRRNSLANTLFCPDNFWLGREDSNLLMVESKSAFQRDSGTIDVLLLEPRFKGEQMKAPIQSQIPSPPPQNSPPHPKKTVWADWASLLSIILTALATTLSAYAALRANQAAESIAALQAVSQFNTAINQYDRAGACSLMVVRTYDRSKLSLLLNRKEFAFDANDDNRESASRCLDKKIATGDKVQVSDEESRRVYQQIFNAFNGYEGILLYWNLHNQTERLVCLEVYPGFDKHVRPLIKEMAEMPANQEAKTLLAGFPALIAFSKTESCGQGN